MSQSGPSLVQNSPLPALPPHDYVSPGLEIIMPDSAFPDMIAGDTTRVDWPFLRHWVEHTWYTDRTSPTTGFIDRDESSLLYNNAKLFRNQPALEIGCWRGWSAVHIARGTHMLDVVDPLLEDAAIAAKIRASFEAANVLDQITLHPGFAPGAVDALAQSSGRRWSFIFIDGSHDGEGPSRDAEAAMRYATPTAMVMFHDLVCPDVAAGLRIMRDAGWRTRVYQTMQIMGVAWRGDVEPVDHTPDPAVFWTLPRHLMGYEVAGWTPVTLPKAPRESGMTMMDRRNTALVRAQAAEDDLLDARKELAGRLLEISDMREQLQVAHADALGARAQLNAALNSIKVEVAEAEFVAIERNAALSRAEAAEANLGRLANAVHEMSAKIPDALAAQAERTLLLTQLDQANQELTVLHQVTADNEILQEECEHLAARAERGEERIELLQLTRALQETQLQEFRLAHSQQEAEAQRLQTDVQKLRLANHKITELKSTFLSDDLGLLRLAQWAARKRIIIGLLRRPALARIAAIRQQAEMFGIGNAITDSALHWIGRRRTLFGLLRRSSGFAELLVSRILIQDAEIIRCRMLERMAAIVS